MNGKSSNGHLFKCYMWLVRTIARYPITRAEIDEKWAQAYDVNDYGQDNIPESTFHRWREAIKMLFDIEIKCNDYNQYYIEEASKLRNADLFGRMLNIMSVNSLLHSSKKLQDKILFEPVPSGEKFLAPIIEALRDQCAIQMTYQSFKRQHPSTFIVEPHCLKMFKQRWYMLAYSPDIDEMRVYGLDRIQNIEPTNQKYTLPDEGAAERYFRNAYGVTVLEGEPEHVTISISEEQAPYLRTLPLHPSQREIDPINGYPAFQFFVYPSDEFCQELFKYGSDVEVHEPEWLRKYFADDAVALNKVYTSK